jgi:two-component system phosphate regulon response regulator PhoB
MAEIAGEKKRVLVIEDDTTSAELIASLLSSESFEPVICRTADEGLRLLKEQSPVAVLLDWGLPDRPGIDVCRQIRAADDVIPILFVSGRTDEATMARGLDAGANDFISKPFRSVEFIARLEAQIRRAHPSLAVARSAGGQVLTFGRVEVDLEGRLVTVAGRPVDLGSYEFKLVEYLARNAGVAVSREQILEHVYGYNANISTDRVDTLVRRVRSKLEDEGQLASVPGFGFRWRR